MSSSTDRPVPPEWDAPFPFVSRAEASAYIGDMAGSLKRIALRSDLPELARRLEDIESTARQALRAPENRRRAKAG